MNPKQQFCHEKSCHASGQVGQGNIVIHSRADKRYKCKCCGKTFTESKGTAVYGLKKAADLYITVISLLSHGCPLQAIVATYELDERTVQAWRVKAGLHCQGVHEHLVEESQLDPGQVQADEIRVKAHGGLFWMSLAMMASTRLWLGGAIRPKRDKQLIRQVAAKVRKVALCRPLLLAVDGLVSYVGAFRAAFRTPLRDGTTGRPRLIAWPDIHIVQVVKRRNAKTLEIERRIVQGDEAQVTALINDSQGGGVINTAFIAPSGHPLNATFRQPGTLWVPLSCPSYPFSRFYPAHTGRKHVSHGVHLQLLLASPQPWANAYCQSPGPRAHRLLHSRHGRRPH